jgi:hypothetical protein
VFAAFIATWFLAAEGRKKRRKQKKKKKKGAGVGDVTLRRTSQIFFLGYVRARRPSGEKPPGDVNDEKSAD